MWVTLLVNVCHILRDLGAKRPRAKHPRKYEEQSSPGNFFPQIIILGHKNDIHAVMDIRAWVSNIGALCTFKTLHPVTQLARTLAL